MKELLTRITADPALLFMPSLLGLGTLIGLLILLRQIRRNPHAHSISAVYIFGSLALSLWVFAGQLVESSQLSLPTRLSQVIQSMLIIVWSYVILELFEKIVLAGWSQRTGMMIPRLARDIVRAVVFIVVSLLVLAQIFNIDMGSVAISSTVLSAVLGLALQDLLKNVIAGVALQIERPFQVGHWIQIGDVMGRVLEMNWRATHLVNIEGNFVIYPNASLAESTVINYSLPEKSQAMHVPITLSKAYDPQQIKALLLQAVQRSAEVLENPAPSVKIGSYGENNLAYNLEFWLSSYDHAALKRDTVLTNVWQALHEAGIGQ